MSIQKNIPGSPSESMARWLWIDEIDLELKQLQRTLDQVEYTLCWLSKCDEAAEVRLQKVNEAMRRLQEQGRFEICASVRNLSLLIKNDFLITSMPTDMDLNKVHRRVARGDANLCYLSQITRDIFKASGESTKTALVETNDQQFPLWHTDIFAEVALVLDENDHSYADTHDNILYSFSSYYGNVDVDGLWKLPLMNLRPFNFPAIAVSTESPIEAENTFEHPQIAAITILRTGMIDVEVHSVQSYAYDLYSGRFISADEFSQGYRSVDANSDPIERLLLMNDFTEDATQQFANIATECLKLLDEGRKKLESLTNSLRSMPGIDHGASGDLHEALAKSLETHSLIGELERMLMQYRESLFATNNGSLLENHVSLPVEEQKIKNLLAEADQNLDLLYQNLPSICKRGFELTIQGGGPESVEDAVLFAAKVTTKLEYRLSKSHPFYDEDFNTLRVQDDVYRCDIDADKQRVQDDLMPSYNWIDYNTPWMTHQSWLTHDALEHNYGRYPCFGKGALLNTGTIVVEVDVTRSYIYDLHAGKFLAPSGMVGD